MASNFLRTVTVERSHELGKKEAFYGTVHLHGLRMYNMAGVAQTARHYAAALIITGVAQQIQI